MEVQEVSVAVCENPFIGADLTPYPCGQCLVCRAKRKSLWADRIMLESFIHGDSSFVTLTYDEDHLPEGGTLRPVDAQLWLKRLRAAIAPQKIRYYLVGEYGEESWRPHYHAAVFGLSILQEDIVRETWSMGHVVVGSLSEKSAAYIAGYVTKKLTKESVNLAGRHPEFQRMSLKPGIGAGAMEDLARVMENEFALDKVVQDGDVPFALKQGKERLMLGRYLRGKLRQYMGFSDTRTPQEALDKWKKEMRCLYETGVVFKAPTSGARRLQWKMKVLDLNKQKLRNVTARSKIYSGRKEL